MNLDPALGYKYWLLQRKAKAFYLEAKFNFIYSVREVAHYEYYYWDTTQSLHLGPYSQTSIGTRKRYRWYPENIRPGISFGYLNNINKHFDWHFKFDIVIAIPDQSPGDLSLFYPKVGVGLAFIEIW